jgi:hypothetical protein
MPITASAPSAPAAKIAQCSVRIAPAMARPAHARSAHRWERKKRSWKKNAQMTKRCRKAYPRTWLDRTISWGVTAAMAAPARAAGAPNRFRIHKYRTPTAAVPARTERSRRNASDSPNRIQKWSTSKKSGGCAVSLEAWDTLRTSGCAEIW